VTFRIAVDTARWRAQVERTRDAVAEAVAGAGGVVPVVKGNGYGLGNAALARESARAGARAIAVGTVHEVTEALADFAGDIVVLEPFDPRDPAARDAWERLRPSTPRLVRTIASEEGWHASIDDADGLGRPVRVVLEGLTSMHRFGLDESDIARLLTDPRLGEHLALEGLALHLPLAQPPAPRRPASAMLHDSSTGIVEHGTARAREAIGWARLWTTLLADRLGAGAAEGAAAIWASHLDDAELASVRAAVPDIPLRARVGTRLWHGDRGSLQASGTVLQVHRTDREVGYRQRRPAKDGSVVVVSGGTAHGVALAAPTAPVSLRARVRSVGAGTLEAAGRARSPFSLRGAPLWFVEPPHVSVSLLQVPRGTPPPSVGDELPCTVRYATTRADIVVWE